MPVLATLTSLKHLCLSFVRFGSSAAEVIAQHITTLSRLSVLGLPRHAFGAECIEALSGTFCHLTALKSLDLSWCDMGGKRGASAIARRLSSLQSLTCLNLEGTHIENSGAAVLVQHLTYLTS